MPCNRIWIIRRLKMKRKVLAVLVAIVALVLCVCMVSACSCGPTETETEKYTVTFDANGGTLTGNATVEVEEGAKITGAPTASKDGFTFDGWFDAATGGNKINLSTYTVTKDVTIYAQYTEDSGPEVTTFTVTFNANGGTLEGNTSVDVEDGGKITGAPTASKDGFTFDGWFDAATGGNKIDLSSYTVTKDVTLYAQYIEDEESEPEPDLPDDIKVEAESAKIEGTPSYGDGFIETAANASGGQSVGNFGTAGNTITFTFEMEEAANGEIIFYMSSTNMDFMSGMIVKDHVVDSSVIKVSLNGKDISFDAQTIRGSGQALVYNTYWDPVSMGTQSLAAGTNTVIITAQGQAPNMDYMLVTFGGGSSEPGGEDPEPEDVPYEKDVTFDMIVGSYAGGPAIEKAVIHFNDAIDASALTDDLFKVSFTSQGWFGPQTATLGQGSGQTVYLSDADGNKVTASSANYVTIEYAVSYGTWSFNGNLSPFTYQTVNTWNNSTTYNLDINDGSALKIGGVDYTSLDAVTAPAEWTVPDLEAWDITGTHTEGDITLTYGSYGTDAMKNDGVKNPLIIWLHGAGEGGTDPSVAILGNQVTNLAKDVIQDYFVTDTVKGAYVLAAQTPTMWMDGGDGEYSNDVASQYYVAALKGLIDAYIEDNGDIDTNRIYVGGCSNGGFMTVNMIINYSDFFAAAFPICEAYPTGDVSAEKVESIKDLPIWFTHSANDNTVSIYNKEGDGWSTPITITTPQDAYTNNLYIRLINAGAENVHYTLFETVNVDGVNYDGHWSWIYTLRDECVNVQPTEGADGDLAITDLDPTSTNKVQVGGEDVTLWGWIAAQSKA